MTNMNELPERLATTQEIRDAVKAYKEGVLIEYIRGKPVQRTFNGYRDTEQVQTALRLQGLYARSTAIIEEALRQKLC